MADRLDLRRDISFETRITSGQVDEAADLWTLTTGAGSVLHATQVITAVGCLSRSNLPQIDGIADFQGRTSHTSDWPRNGVDFTGLRVAIIGTGSSAIQANPEIARQAGHLTVFQRTPNFSVPAKNQPLSNETVDWWKSN